MSSQTQRFVVIGLGHFGSWAARALYADGHEVIVVEKQERLVDRYGPELTRAVAGDASKPGFLEEIEAGKADAAIISTGGDLTTSILVTQALNDLGLEEIYVKVTSREAARALEALGVQETIFPEREVADRLAHRIVSETVLEYLPLGEHHSVQEIAIPEAWLGKTLRELALPRDHGIHVVATYNLLTKTMKVVPDPDGPLKESHVAIIAGRDKDIQEVLEEL